MTRSRLSLLCCFVSMLGWFRFCLFVSYLHPQAVKYTWWDVKTGMRPKDLGYRLGTCSKNKNHIIYLFFWFVTNSFNAARVVCFVSNKQKDYFFVHHSLVDKVEECDMMTTQRGSDHCPIVLNLRDMVIPKSEKSPMLSSEKIRPVRVASPPSKSISTGWRLHKDACAPLEYILVAALHSMFFWFFFVIFVFCCFVFVSIHRSNESCPGSSPRRPRD